MYIISRIKESFSVYKIFMKIYETAKDCKKYYSPTKAMFLCFFYCALKLYIKKGFEPKEVFSLGLHKSNFDEEHLKMYVSFNHLNHVLTGLNPLSWRHLTSDKDTFYKYCQSVNLPIPLLYAILNRQTTSVDFSGSIINGKEGWVKFVKEKLSDEFVIKPARGEWGEFVNIYTKTKDGIKDGYGKMVSEKDIYTNTMENTKHDTFIVQERLYNHQEFFNISPSKYLHCVRIITMVDLSGQFRILHAQLNLVTGQSIISQGGDLKIKISLQDGCLEYGVFLNRNDGGFRSVTENFDTGQTFRGFRLPLWEEALSLSKEAAFKFLPLRSVGWDITMTENGVKLLEANSPYGPPNYFRPMDQFIKILTDEYAEMD
jgi:hypothetical protein